MTNSRTIKAASIIFLLAILGAGCDLFSSFDGSWNHGTPRIGEYRPLAWTHNDRLLVEHIPKNDEGSWLFDLAGLYSIDLTGSDLRPVVLNREIGGTIAYAVVSPDGSWIAFAGGGHINLVRTDGTGLAPVIPYPGRVVPGFSWSPDGEWLVYNAIYMDDSHESGLWVVRAKNPEERYQLAWPTEWRERCPHCESEPAVPTGWGMFGPQWLANSSLIAYVPGQQMYQIAVHDRDKARVEFVLTLSPIYGNVHDLRYSHAANKLAFTTMRSQKSTELQTGVLRPDGTSLQWFRHTGDHPIWSPDGRRIAYRRYDLEMDARPCRAGMDEIWIMNADGRNRLQVTHSNRKPYCS
jgi:hypothetical protein